MTTLVRTRQPLQILSMSNQPERRQSKRLAAEPTTRSRARKRKDPAAASAAPVDAGTNADLSSSSAAAAVYDEQDGDFLFTRGPKRTKTAPVPEEDELGEEPEPEPEPVPAPAPAKKSVGRPPKSGTRRRASPPAPAAISAAQPIPTRSRSTATAVTTVAAAAPTTRRTSKRKSGSDDTPPSPPPEDLVIPKSKTRRKARESTAEKGSQQSRTRARQVNGAYRGAGKEEAAGYEEERPHQLLGDDSTPNTSTAQPQSQVIALPFSDTPIINRNKEFRKKGGANGGRRSSLGMRGRRASSLIDNGHSALPHREVNPAEFYKYISADGLSEPRRMKQLLVWCGERALSEKPPHGKPGSSAILGARAIQDQLLKDFGARSEFSDWFAREDAPKPPVPVILQPNPRNVDYDAKIAELEAKIERLKAQKAAWQSIAAPLPLPPPLFPDAAPDSADPRKTAPPLPPPPDPSLLSSSEASILSALTTTSGDTAAGSTAAFSSFRRQARSRLQNAQAALDFRVDRLADGAHKLGARVAVAGREADAVLALGAARLREREERERRAVGTARVSVMEVLRSLGRILPPEGG
ncbi:Mis12-Mtw1 protein family-domain-containing protein [Corynascus similis CBS 632.67]